MLKTKSVNKKNFVSMDWTVQELIKGLDVIYRKGDCTNIATCLITDSRRVVPGALFFAISGLRTNGNFYAEEAVDRGAVAVITEQDLGPHFPTDFVQVTDVRRSLALIARRFYDSPDEKLELAGVTGTNGKTTTMRALFFLAVTSTFWAGRIG